MADWREEFHDCLITPQKVLNLIVGSAKKTEIPYQFDIVTGGISIPSRCIHMPLHGCCISDIENTAKSTVGKLAISTTVHSSKRKLQ